MKNNRKVLAFCACFFSFTVAAATASAQMGMGMRQRSLPSGLFNPVVGSGAAYDVQTSGGQKTSIEYVVVGKESVDGKDGYWMEWTTAAGAMGQMIMKVLIVPGAGSAQKVIMQMPGHPPMEMPMQMGHGNAGATTPSDIRNLAEDVGTESVTTPGGTFSCEHYRMKDGSGDTWVSQKVAPFGVVKHEGKDSSMVLTKVITGATDKITGTPQPFNPMMMMQQQAPPQE
ncbi:MAG TPA: hypothetical protein VHX36_06025 [Candidatus Acidoferrales bacterium]|jgi:hypothetical protein|nr:hypothetical protein [Candidatus Acidoferrales bacterium]